MNYFSKLFSKAPFDYLQLHMEKVASCMAKLGEIFQILEGADLKKIEQLSIEVSQFEHEADIIKNDIRATLPKSFLFPVDRTHFLDILAMQDNLADCAEDIAEILVVKNIEIFPEIKGEFKQYVDKATETVWDVKAIVATLDELLETSFGGPPAEKVKGMIDQTSYKEHEADRIRHSLTKCLFQRSHMSAPDFFLWMRLIEEIGKLAHDAEKLALRIGMLLYK